MHRLKLNSIIIVLAVALFSSCSQIPEHAKYIPKDAVVVAGINLKSLGKKIAWNVITGSKLFKEMQDRMPQKNAKDAVSGIEKAGLDFANTFYVYAKSSGTDKDVTAIVGLLPLSDAGQWEEYLKVAFPKAQVTQHGDRKEAVLAGGMCIGWNKKLLIIVTVKKDNVGMADVSEQSPVAVAEMENAFNVTSEKSMTGNAHFAALEKEGHDVTILVNYEQMMDQMSSSLAEKMSMSLSSSLWKDAAMATGIDFEKGKISGDVHYYLSPEMNAIGVAMGSKNADNEMISRLPNHNVDMVAALHLSPDAIKQIMEKMNLLGLANLGLSGQGLSVESVLESFTGDMAFVMNDFSLHAEPVTDTFMGQPIIRKNEKPSVSMSYVIKINNKNNFKKLMDMAKGMGMQTIDNGYVIPLTVKDSIYIMANDQYLVASNKYIDATGFLQGSFKTQKMPDAISAKVTGNPCSFYFDVQQFCKNLDAGLASSPHDSVMISESKKLLNNISLSGGSFKNNAFEYRMEINFMNSDENSIIALMDYGMRMSDAAKSDPL